MVLIVFRLDLGSNRFPTDRSSHPNHGRLVQIHSPEEADKKEKRQKVRRVIRRE
jgi:hypothetical protein